MDTLYIYIYLYIYIFPLVLIGGTLFTQHTPTGRDCNCKPHINNWIHVLPFKRVTIILSDYLSKKGFCVYTWDNQNWYVEATNINPSMEIYRRLRHSSVWFLFWPRLRLSRKLIRNSKTNLLGLFDCLRSLRVSTWFTKICFKICLDNITRLRVLLFHFKQSFKPTPRYK